MHPGFADPNIEVVWPGAEGQALFQELGLVLPHRFGPEFLNSQAPGRRTIPALVEEL